MKEELLVLAPLDEEYLDRIGKEFSMQYVPLADLDTIGSRGGNVRAVWTNGTVGLSGAAIEALPRLEMVHAHGAGFDQVDLDAIRTRGITFTNGAGTNDACVADHAMALLLSLLRDIPRRDRLSHEGAWAESRTNRPALYGSRMGIVGLGKIGRHIAKRAAGFDVDISYFGRRPHGDVPYRYMADLRQMAAACDILVLSCVGGKETFHIVDTPVLEALGPNGFLVNVARGSVVDPRALVAALRSGRVGGAALDVFENEPGIPEYLRGLQNVILSPHVAGLASQVRDEQIKLGLSNFKRFFAGEPVQNVVVGRVAK